MRLRWWERREPLLAPPTPGDDEIVRRLAEVPIDGTWFVANGVSFDVALGALARRVLGQERS